MSSDSQPPVLDRAVAVGGGHGQARTLRALTSVATHVTAIATAADDGGSSGRLRRDLGVLPPGDLRMALAALTPNPLLARLLDHRFAAGELRGHSVGNLVMVALAELEDGVVAGLDRLAELLDVPHRVLPSTLADVHLAATSPGGEVVGQAAVAATVGVHAPRLVGEEPVALPEAVAAIADAELVVLGPGSVLTSVAPNLLVPGIADAVRRTTAPVVLVANLEEQRGEGEGRSLADHVALLAEVAPGLRPDVVVAHDGPEPTTGRTPLRADADLAGATGRVVTADLLSRGPTGGHDPAALARVLRSLVS